MNVDDWLTQVLGRAPGDPIPPAPPAIPDLGWRNPFARCIEAGDVQALERLLWVGWDLNERGLAARSLLRRPEMYDFLISRGLDLNATDQYGASPLDDTVLSGQTDAVRRLIDWGVLVDLADRDGRTPLWHASNRRRPGCLRLLLQAGADPNLADRYGQIPLMKARTREILMLLLEAGSRVDACDERGRSVFDHFSRRPLALEILIGHAPEAAVPVEYRLWWAFQRGQRGSFQELLAGSLPKLKPDQAVVWGQTILWWASALGLAPEVENLCRAGWDPQKADLDRRTPVGVARKKRVIEILTSGSKIGGAMAGQDKRGRGRFFDGPSLCRRKSDGDGDEPGDF